MKQNQYFTQFRQWLNNADEHFLDAFVAQNEYLIRHLYELAQGLQSALQPPTLPVELTKENSAMPIVERTLNHTEPAAITQVSIQSSVQPLAPKLQVVDLKNANQDEAYYCAQSDQIGIKDVSFSSECGLRWDADNRAIVGTPSQSGEITLHFRLDDGSVVSKPLFINPNPKRLWQNIPSDRQSRFWKADSANEILSTPAGKLIAARQRGRSHAHKGTCCDDDFALAFHQPSGVHFLAVADGAGSAEFSREGSKIAVDAAKNKVLELLNNTEKSYKNLSEFSTDTQISTINTICQGLFTNAVQAAFEAQQKTATDADIPLKSLSCTLLLAFTVQCKDGRWFSACYWVGDGAVAVFDPNAAQVKLLGEVDSGLYSGETQFLTAHEANVDQLLGRIRTDIRDYPPLLMLMTDGVSDPKFATDAQLHNAQKWQDLWAELHEPLTQDKPSLALEDWLDFFSKGEHDDRTMALFVPTAMYPTIQCDTADTVSAQVKMLETAAETAETVQAAESQTTSGVFSPESINEAANVSVEAGAGEVVSVGSVVADGAITIEPATATETKANTEAVAVIESVQIVADSAVVVSASVAQGGNNE